MGILETNPPQVAVLGAGLMGTAIAAAHIRCGMPVMLYDTAEQVLAAAPQRVAEQLGSSEILCGCEKFSGQLLRCTGNLGEVQRCGMIIETITEKLRVKQKLYRQLTGICGGETLLLTNTSTISVTSLADTLEADWQRRFCGFHFFHPVAERNLLELIPGKNTSAETAGAVRQHALRLGKKPITVGDTPGFLVNRILHPYLSAALTLLDQGENWRQIERIAVHFGMKKGPFQMIDEIGLDVVLHGGYVLYKAFPDKVKMPPLLLQLVREGCLGVKTGSGIRDAADKFHRHKTEYDIDADTVTKIINGLFISMYKETLCCYADGVIKHLPDADTASVEALGFPADKEGIVSWGRKEVGNRELSGRAVSSPH
ncbi:MAG: 3-hydroxyacyl-CoA dehydrogenase family protein [Planctomycetaceae bacterium]|jgi:3-hydroxyacyl-CoA dehydrogenase/enoyl-CoA hydratase/3-hydroxybutyryl-CoA epimerase/enoyl-CoA isomerase|nr:3-hydroxyacyl-CoA dehydrogenase family protein [Planctomycetaceae bacterium]